MQLGTRWSLGATPPRAVPSDMHEAIAAVEATLPATEPQPRWTLTWLEGRAHATLDTGVVVSQEPTGEVVVRHEDDTFA